MGHQRLGEISKTQKWKSVVEKITSIAGGAAGAAWGREAVPSRWLQKLHQRDYVEQTAERLAQLAQATREEDARFRTAEGRP